MKKKTIKAWAEVDNRGNVQKEAIGQFEIYDKKKNGSENPWRVNHSTKLVKCEITFNPQEKDLKENK
jgi:hypothetical protein